MNLTYETDNRISRRTLHQIIFTFLHTVRDNIGDIIHINHETGEPFITGSNADLDLFIENNLETFLSFIQKLSQQPTTH